jgi:hypothetical protein
MTKSMALYCKSYRIDLKRIVRLAKSIARFNTENIPFYVSVPTSDVSLFSKNLSDFDVKIIADESIIQCNPKLDPEQVNSLPGNISQQIVKSEFWRLGISKSYLCLDSDAFFIRPFYQKDFLWNNEIPYTVMDESREFLEESLLSGNHQIVADYLREAEKIQRLFGRTGKAYAFGPFPVVWHRLVWESLETEHLQPRGMTLVDAILQAPLESRWYGEALLRYQAIPLMPCQPLFKVYHYAWQLDRDRRVRVGFDRLAQLYSGVIYQSTWEREMDWPTEGGSQLSRMARRLRRLLGRT